MSHTFLALDMSLIPQLTKDNVPTFWQGLFSNDGSRMLIDGYSDKRQLVHSKQVLDAWLQWEVNAQETQQQLIDTAIEYTSAEIKERQTDVGSIWYVEQVEI